MYRRFCLLAVRRVVVASRVAHQNLKTLRPLTLVGDSVVDVVRAPESVSFARRCYLLVVAILFGCHSSDKTNSIWRQIEGYKDLRLFVNNAGARAKKKRRACKDALKHASTHSFSTRAGARPVLIRRRRMWRTIRWQSWTRMLLLERGQYYGCIALRARGSFHVWST